MSNDDHVTYVGKQKPARLVYSMLASYGAARGGLLPGSWFVAALSAFGHSPTSIRQTLYRMSQEGSLETVVLGRHKLYRLSSIGRASTDAGTARFHALPTTDWDGLWTVVSYEFRTDQRRLRDLVSGLLSVEGFASMARATYIHPRDRAQRLTQVFTEQALIDQVHVFRAKRQDGLSDTEFVYRHWDLDTLRRGYDAFVREFRPLARRRQWSRIDPTQAVAVRFRLVLTYLETAWRDPDIPLPLLPARWPAPAARELAAELYQCLNGSLLEYGDHVFHQLPETVRRACVA